MAYKYSLPSTIPPLIVNVPSFQIAAPPFESTFVNLTKKANMSADQVAVKNMNTLLATEFAAEKPTELKQVIDMLDKNGYNVDALIPLSKGYVFLWNSEENKIELVLEADAGEKTKLEDGQGYINMEIDNSDDFAAALFVGKEVTLTKNITLNQTVNVNGDVTIDMNNFKINGASIEKGRVFDLGDGAKVTINAGNDATIVLNGGKYIAETNNGSFIKPRGNGIISITLNNVVYEDKSENGAVVACENYTGKDFDLTVTGGNYKAAEGFRVHGKAVIKEATINSAGFAIEGFYENTIVTVIDCVINTKGGCTMPDSVEVPPYGIFAGYNSKIIVNNCSINSDLANLCVANTGGEIEATGSGYTYKIITPKEGVLGQKVTINSEMYTQPN